MNRFTDILQHLYLETDDAAVESGRIQSLLTASYEDGIGTIILTPHMTPGIIPFDEEAFKKAFAQAQARCIEAGLPLTLLPGVEINYTHATPEYIRQGRIPSYANTKHMLISFTPGVTGLELEKGLEQVLKNGYTPILAHVEQYHCMARRPDAAIRLRANYGLCYQLDAASIVTNMGIGKTRLIKALMDADSVDFIASNAGGLPPQPPQMKAAHAIITADYSKSVADRLLGINGYKFLR